MRRISTWEQAYNDGTVAVDFGDGIELTLRDTSAFPAALDAIGDLERAAPAFSNINMFASMDAGHGWTAGPATTAAFVLEDPMDSIIGTRPPLIRITAAGGSGYIEKKGMSLDLKGKGLVFWVKVTDLEAIKAVSLTIGNADDLRPSWFGALPLGAGHKSPISDGEWTPLFFSFGNTGILNGAPTRDRPITTIRLTLQAGTGSALPSLRLGGVGTFPDTAPAYPAGVVSLTFDDTWQSHRTAARMMARYGYPGTEYLIQSKVGEAGALSRADLQTMEALGWEIGSHASNAAAHTDWTAKPLEWIEAELAAQMEFQRANGYSTESFAYPIGPHNTATAAAAKRAGFASARSTYPWVNSAVSPHRYRLSCYVIAASTTLDAAKIYVDRAAAGGGWLSFLFHDLVTENPTGNDWLLSDFAALLEYIAAAGIPVDTVGNVIRRINK